MVSDEVLVPGLGPEDLGGQGRSMEAALKSVKLDEKESQADMQLPHLEIRLIKAAGNLENEDETPDWVNADEAVVYVREVFSSFVVCTGQKLNFLIPSAVSVLGGGRGAPAARPSESDPTRFTSVAAYRRRPT